MTNLGILTQLLALVLAILAGRSLATQGVITGQLSGTVNIRVWRWKFIAQGLNFRDDKTYVRAAILAV